MDYKDFLFNPITILGYANKALRVKHMKYFWKLFLSWKYVFYYVVMLCWILEKIKNWLELIWSSKAEVIKETRNRKEKEK
jgi:hypothetical protein